MNRSVEIQSVIIKPIASRFRSASNNSIALADRPCAQPKISCVIPAFNEGENLKVLLPQLAECISAMTSKFEILIIDDGSQDDTYQTAVELSKKFNIKAIQFSRNFGKEAAITAGLEHADGNLVILMDGDCQHTTAALPQFLARWREGYDMVYGVRKGREAEPIWKRYFSNFFYSLMKSATSVPIIPDAGDFRLMDICVVNAINELPERSRFMKGLYAWVGFKSIGCPYEVQDRHAGSTSFNFKRLTQLALTGIVSFSDIPLRVWSSIGALLSLMSILYGLYILVRTLVNGIDVPGWSTITVCITFLGGIQLLSIGVLGEYIGRIFNEVKQRPIYIMSSKSGFDAESSPK
jgi:polyisoprenyl-phosphate glycosyltransferase